MLGALERRRRPHAPNVPGHTRDGARHRRQQAHAALCPRGLGARLGMPVLPATLLYVDGGYTHAGFKFAYSDDTSAYTNGHASNGWFLGVGVEQRVTRNMSLKLAYRNAHFINQRVGNAGNTGCVCGVALPGCPLNNPFCVPALDQATHYMEPSTNSVGLSVNFNLGQ